MTDPRNIAHDKKVQHDKVHAHDETARAAGDQPGKKPHLPEASPSAPAQDAAEPGEPAQK
jgi:hypothetical protein